MDPVSLSVGVVAFGIQLFKDVSEYRDGLNGAKDVLDSVSTLLGNFRLLLNALEASMQKLKAADLEDAVQMLQGCVAQIEKELYALKSLIQELRVVGGDGRTLSERLKDKKRKLSYPIRRDAIAKLEDRLGRLNGLLSSAMTVVEMYVNQCTYFWHLPISVDIY